MKKSIPVRERFESKITISGENDCWNWKGTYLATGYGGFHLKVNGVKKFVRANRYAWINFRGEDPKENLVLHKCDNKACVNPNHLYLGDKKQNTKDAIERGQHLTGDRCKNWIRTEGLVDRCNDLRRQGYFYREIRAWLGISNTTLLKCIGKL